MRSATAFAPATSANVVVGFDVLGHALERPGDEVTVERVDEPGVWIDSIDGAEGLPMVAEQNTAGAALLHLIAAQGLRGGFRVRIHKGLPAASGIGSSAASAVAAVVAANALLDDPLPREALLDAALAGEAVASGARHADNVAPALYGGLVLSLGDGAGNFRVVRIPVPAGLRCVLVRPALELKTSDARAALAADVPLALATRQAAHLGAFIVACHSGDLELLAASMRDLIVGPQRAPLVLGFADAQAAALEAGALGCSLSGAGPSVMAWVTEEAAAVRDAITAAFSGHGVACESWTSRVDAPGARIR